MNNDFTIALDTRRHIEYHNARCEDAFQVTLADTGLNTMTGGRIQRVRPFVNGTTFMVTYGDGVADIDLGRLLDFHRSHGKLATVTTVQPASRFGILEVGRTANVAAFREKPQVHEWISAGFFVFEPGVFDYFTGDDCIMEREPLARLAADGQLMAYRHDGYFFAMDTFREYEHLNAVWNSGSVPWKVWD